MTTEADRQVLLDNRFLFWDVNVEDIDTEKHANYIIERFLEYGTLEGVRWLRTFYGDEKIRQFLLTKRFRICSKKTLNYWRLIFNISSDEWNKPYLRIPNKNF